MSASYWEPTCELRRFDDTPKLTGPRLQQKWVEVHGTGRMEWRDVPLVWKRPSDDAATETS